MFGIKAKSNYRRCGFFKGVIRIRLGNPADIVAHNKRVHSKPRGEGAPGKKEDMFSASFLSRVMVPKNVVVRVYCLKGLNIVPMDVGGGKSDPYIKLEVGQEVVSGRKFYIKDATDPGFYRCFEVTTTLPGASRLKVTCMDYDWITGDDTVGP